MSTGKDDWINGCTDVSRASERAALQIIDRMAHGLCQAFEHNEVTTSAEAAALVDRLTGLPDPRYIQVAEVVVPELTRVGGRSTTALPLADAARWVIADRANDALRRYVLGLDDKQHAAELLRRGEHIVRQAMPPFDVVELAQNEYITAILLHNAGDAKGARAALSAASRILDDAERAVRAGKSPAHEKARPMVGSIRKNIETASAVAGR